MFKSRFPKSRHTGGRWLIHDSKRRQDNQLQSLKLPCKYPSWVARCDMKGSDGTMLNPIFWEKVQRQKHPARWDIAERCLKQIPMVTNILVLVYLSESKTQLVKPKKTSGIQHRNRTTSKYSPIDCDGVQLQQYWTTPPVYVYMRPITRTRIKNAYI